MQTCPSSVGSSSAGELGFVRIGEITPSVTWPEDRLLGSVQYRVVVHGTAKTHRIWAHSMSLFFGGLTIPHRRRRSVISFM